MKYWSPILLHLSIILCASFILAQAEQIPDFHHAHSLILVTTPDWNSVDGTLTRYFRDVRMAPRW